MSDPGELTMQICQCGATAWLRYQGKHALWLDAENNWKCPKGVGGHYPGVPAYASLQSTSVPTIDREKEDNWLNDLDEALEALKQRNKTIADLMVQLAEARTKALEEAAVLVEQIKQSTYPLWAVVKGIRALAAPPATVSKECTCGGNGEPFCSECQVRYDEKHKESHT